MPTDTDRIWQQALALGAAERAALAQRLLSSLDEPDARVDALWLREAEDRLAAFRAGEMDAIPLDEARAEFDRL